MRRPGAKKSVGSSGMTRSTFTPGQCCWIFVLNRYQGGLQPARSSSRFSRERFWFRFDRERITISDRRSFWHKDLHYPGRPACGQFRISMSNCSHGSDSPRRALRAISARRATERGRIDTAVSACAPYPGPAGQPEQDGSAEPRRGATASQCSKDQGAGRMGNDAVKGRDLRAVYAMS